jgi:hypothetical protein
MIEVTQTRESDPFEFDVRVEEANGESRHRVTMSAQTLESLGQGVAASDFIRAAFEFLLEREPKEAILSRFDVSVIGRYFPEFEQEIGSYLR